MPDSRLNPAAEVFATALKKALREIEDLKNRLQSRGFTLTGNEPLKLTLNTKSFGYTGREIAEYLEKQNVICEFSDPDFLVMMFSPYEITPVCARVADALLGLERREPISAGPPAPPEGTQALSLRQAMTAPSELLPINQCPGRILAEPSVGCPPAVPPLICGQRIEEAHLDVFRYYGVSRLRVVKENG